MSWLDSFFKSGYKNVAIAGVLFANEATLNFAAGASAADNVALGRTDVTINPTQIQGIGISATPPTDGQLLQYIASSGLWTPSSFTPLTPSVVLVAHAQSPVTGVANTAYEVDASGGTVIINCPALTPGQWISVKLQNTPATNNVTVNAPSGKTIENPPNIGGGPGTLSASVVFNSVLQVGDDILWRCVANSSPYGTGNLELASK